MIRVHWLAAALTSLFVVAAGAHAADDGAGVDDESTRKNGWSPGLNMSLNIFNLDGDGSVTSTVGQSTTGTGHLTLGEFRFGLDLLTPEVDLAITKAKFMLLGGFQVGPETDITMAQEGAFVVNLPDNDVRNAITANANNGTPFPPNSAYRGQASLVIATYEGWGWYAGLGAQFDVPGLEDLLRLRPYALYVGEKMSASGELASVTGVGPNLFVQRSLVTSDEDFHYIGPGLELDLVLTQSRRLEIIAYTAGDFLFNVGDGEILMRTGTTAFNPVTGVPVPGQGGLVTYAYSTPSFRFNLQFGLRFTWRDMFGG